MTVRDFAAPAYSFTGSVLISELISPFVPLPSPPPAKRRGEGEMRGVPKSSTAI